MKALNRTRKSKAPLSPSANELDKVALEHALGCWFIARDALPKGCLPGVAFSAADNAVTIVSITANMFGRQIMGVGHSFEDALTGILAKADPANEAKRLRAQADALTKEVAS